MKEDTPCLEHPFAEFMAAENYVSDGERAWLAWAKKVKRLANVADLDGNQDADGYSLDMAYAAWESGASAETYATEVKGALLSRGCA